MNYLGTAIGRRQRHATRARHEKQGALLVPKQEALAQGAGKILDLETLLGA
ncbi:hypothetical protein D3C83_288290 [compost metagenome]